MLAAAPGAGQLDHHGHPDRCRSSRDPTATTADRRRGSGHTSTPAPCPRLRHCPAGQGPAVPRRPFPLRRGVAGPDQRGPGHARRQQGGAAVRARRLPAAGHECRLLVRIGAAWAPEHGQDAAHCCDVPISLCTKRPVSEGRSRCSMRPSCEKAERESQMEDDFLRALDCGGLALHFQPQIDCRTGRCAGAEALLRWPSASGGPVAPLQTIEVAERLGVGAPVDALDPAPGLPLRGRVRPPRCRRGRLSVNLTAGRRRGSGIAARGAQCARSVASRTTDCSKFELTESAMLANEAVSAPGHGFLARAGRLHFDRRLRYRVFLGHPAQEAAPERAKTRPFLRRAVRSTPIRTARSSAR
ncbi:MAG: EAL domain-containing protein [Chromatiales bacterium]|nr:EAL domain-containing protein [Chromatiales bacterium]